MQRACCSYKESKPDTQVKAATYNIVTAMKNYDSGIHVVKYDIDESQIDSGIIIYKASSVDSGYSTTYVVKVTKIAKVIPSKNNPTVT